MRIDECGPTGSANSQVQPASGPLTVSSGPDTHLWKKQLKFVAAWSVSGRQFSPPISRLQQPAFGCLSASARVAQMIQSHKKWTEMKVFFAASISS